MIVNVKRGNGCLLVLKSTRGASCELLAGRRFRPTFATLLLHVNVDLKDIPECRTVISVYACASPVTLSLVHIHVQLKLYL